jgi:hypothetical protein
MRTIRNRIAKKELKMTKARLDGAYLVMLGSVAFVLLSVALENSSADPMADFKSVYYGARCLIQHCDPYNQSEFLRVYMAEGGDHASDPVRGRRSVVEFVNLPTALVFTAPVAMLPWAPAHLLWIVLTAGTFILAAFLVWTSAADRAPIVAGGLVCLLLANSELLIVMGNTAGIVISLCAIAVWCFLTNRFVPAGVLCLAVSLALKPHDAGLIWLYFLLAGKVHRKRALQALALTVALSLPGILWVSHVAPHWMQELHSNLQATSARGDLNDPGPASMGGHRLGMIIDLQTVISVFRDDPRVYNPVSYLICAPLFLVWILVTLRSRFSLPRAWLALAAIAALSMLPVYHRQYDAKLLLLTVPACAMLWSEGGPLRWIALLVNAAGFLLSGDFSWALMLGLFDKLQPSMAGPFARTLTDAQIFAVPLTLLIVGIFYLWVYVRRCPADAQPAVFATPGPGTG